MKPDIVFLGPSLRRAEAQAIYPEAILLPPAAVGDVISATRFYQPHAIALIDGAFMQNLATYHKELIDVMAKGIWVIGASSMGALRAVECERYGMIGVGQVFNAYKTGEIEDDDEVALSHLAAEFDFRPVSEAMVNIRATMAAAVAAGTLSEAEADRLIAVQKQRWFMDRLPLVSVDDAIAELNFDPSKAGELSAFLKEHWVDVKAGDAREALRRLQQLPDGPIPVEERPQLYPSGVYSYMVEHDLTVGADDNLPVTRDQVWRHFVLSDQRAPAVVHHALLRAAAVDLMHDQGIEPTNEELEEAAETLAARLGVSVGELTENPQKWDLSEFGMREWIHEEAAIRKLLNWRQWKRFGRGNLDACLRQLARMDLYESAKRTAGLVESMASGSGHYQAPLGLTSALKLQSTISSVKLPVEGEELDQFVHEMGLGSRTELYERLAAHIAAHRELFDLPAIEFVPPDEELDHSLQPQTSRGR